MTTQPTVTGRSAWTRRGFPVDPATGKGFTMMYRRHLTAPMTGSIPATPPEGTTADDWIAVNYGVKAIQMLLGTTPVDGLLGPMTERDIKSFQTRNLLDSDGIVGPVTIKVLIAPLMVANTTSFGIVDRLLYGIVQQESMKDPGAVGYGTPADKGLVQINMNAHGGDITLAEAFTPSFSLRWAANNLRTQHDRYLARTGASKGNEALSWNCAVANHNSPAQADRWAQTGTAPSTQIADYVAKVRKAAAA